ncbi:hypothetical protein N7508_007167 [Penicillium antarcticum]|uniref:uncharacterized protein n=1 Tax=Penicillium antarcticum TaxID=416450 RepID=UPI0023A2B69E|nr:uncharacterized protein N7508_007167 [Penicillium antarcticum]KAJ5302304.1 hypothetical protein N7508_007167 [Penicillium antarcticum]
MSDFEQDYAYEASLALNNPNDLWEPRDPFFYFSTNENAFHPQANTDSYNDFSAFAQQQDVVMGNINSETEAYPERSSVPSTEFYRDRCDYRAHDVSQPDEVRSSSATSTYDTKETKADSDTLEELPITVKQVNSVLSQCSALSEALGNKLEGISSRFDHAEHRLENMEHRMNDLSQGMESLESKFNTLSGYLLEVIKREQMVMQEIGDMASRYHERDI